MSREIDDYHDFRIPRGFVVSEDDPTRHSLLIREALTVLSERYLNENGCWGIKYMFSGRMCNWVITQEEKAVKILTDVYKVKTGKQEYEIIASNNARVTFQDTYHGGLFYPDKGLNTLYIHGPLNTHFINIMSTAVESTTTSNSKF